jgi:sterol 3beta-glucosyltransferase
MKICVSTVGSDGDIQPYLALAKALSQRGHEILFHAADHYKARIEKHGLRFHLLSEWDPTAAAELGVKMLSTRNPLKHMQLLYDTLGPEFLKCLPRSQDAVSQVDLVINHVINTTVTVAAEAQKKPIISGHLFPNVIPSPKISPMGGAGNPILNRALWWLVSFGLRRTTDGTINKVFEAAGLPPGRDHLTHRLHSPLLNLIALSPRLLAKDHGLSDRYKITGYWYLDEPDYTPEPSLEKFLSEGEPPVLVTFGSMTGMDVDKQNQILLEGIKRSGKRAIFQSGWAGFGAGELPPQVLKIGVVPHSWLLPRVGGIIHHGGAGTTGASFRAGIPQGIVWHLGDQSSWGKQSESLGVGLPTIWYQKLSPEWVERAVNRLTGDQSLKQKAKQLGEEIRSERGLEEAVRLIEEVGAKHVSR